MEHFDSGKKDIYIQRIPWGLNDCLHLQKLNSGNLDSIIWMMNEGFYFERMCREVGPRPWIRDVAPAVEC
jgi:hypothetical protein